MHITKKNLYFINKLYNFIKNNHINEIPIASLILENNTILSLKKNNPKKNSPLDHAECLVIKETLKKYKKPDLSNCILFTTLEPCLMCTGSAINSHLKIIYYLCKSEDSGIQTKYNLHCINNISIIPILIYENEINFLLKSYFKNKR